jgi:hypothetical protein
MADHVPRGFVTYKRTPGSGAVLHRVLPRRRVLAMSNISLNGGKIGIVSTD